MNVSLNHSASGNMHYECFTLSMNHSASGNKPSVVSTQYPTGVFPRSVAQPNIPTQYPKVKQCVSSIPWCSTCPCRIYSTRHLRDLFLFVKTLLCTTYLGKDIQAVHFHQLHALLGILHAQYCIFYIHTRDLFPFAKDLIGKIVSLKISKQCVSTSYIYICTCIAWHITCMHNFYMMFYMTSYPRDFFFFVYIMQKQTIANSGVPV